MECAWEREKENEGGNAEVASQPCLTSSLHTHTFTHTRAHTAKKAAKAESELECLVVEEGKEEEGI